MDDGLKYKFKIKLHGLKRKDVAKKMGISEGMLSLFLNNKSGLNRSSIKKLEELFEPVK